MSEVTGCGILKVFLTKNVKEIFWDLKFLSEVTGCRKLRCQIVQIPLYIQNISYTQTLSEIDHDDEYISQWSKGDDTFVLARNLLSFPFLKLIQINIILSDNVHTVYYIYTHVLTKP